MEYSYPTPASRATSLTSGDEAHARSALTQQRRWSFETPEQELLTEAIDLYRESMPKHLEMAEELLAGASLGRGFWWHLADVPLQEI